jgi:hypothetical protein
MSCYIGAERDMVLLYHKFGIQWPDGRKEQRTSTLISYGGDGGEKPHGMCRVAFSFSSLIHLISMFDILI